MVGISVVIPVYGVEKYIERCARSLFEQDCRDSEYIFIDDCTPDNSISILTKVIELYPGIHEQVRIIHHQRNMGLPQARKTGIFSAKGRYIFNCDSDDWLVKGILNKVLEIIESEAPDVVIMDYYKTDGITFNSYKGLINLEKTELLKDMLIGNITYSVWNKIFKKEVYFNKVTFPTKSMGEDLGLTLQLMKYVNSVSYLPLAGYNYYVNPSSMTKIRSLEDAICSFKCVMANIDLAEGSMNDFQKQSYRDEIIKLKHTKRCLFLYPYRNNEDARKLLINTYSEINFQLFNNKYITIADKLRFLLVLIKITKIKRI